MTLFASSRTSLRPRPHTRPRAASVIALAAMTSVGLLVALAGPAQAATLAPPLGTADSFAVLGGSVVTNTGPTTLSGDLGTYPTTTVTGSGSIVFASGVNHAGDAVTQGAKTDLVTAYDAAAGAVPQLPIVQDPTGLTLIPGVYHAPSSILLSGTVTLDAGGDPSAVFIFQAPTTLTTGSSSLVVLKGGAQACNVFWQVGSSATLGTGSTFRGTILALQSITVTTGVIVEGRVLARNGATTLDTDTITRTSCAAAPAAVAAATPAPQVTQVPAGPVSAGDGSASGVASPGAAAYLSTGVLALMALAAAGLVVARRRRVNI